jgi:hypothetical protein
MIDRSIGRSIDAAVASVAQCRRDRTRPNSTELDEYGS